MAGKGHHGGAWKVAYADFITAMMALFLVLWLTSQDVKIKQAVERSFRNPLGISSAKSIGVMPDSSKTVEKKDTGNFDSISAVELTILRRINEDLLKSLKSETEMKDDNPVQLELTPDGLRVSIFDRSRRPIFEPQSIRFTPYGDWVFSTLSWEISRFEGLVVELEGHTEQGTKALNGEYGSWELSSDRATAARRKLLEHGVMPDQIKKVAGFGDTVPMGQTKPTDESNRRVTVLLRLCTGERI